MLQYFCFSEPEEPHSDLRVSKETESNNLTHKKKKKNKSKFQSVGETSVDNGEANNSSASDVAISNAGHVNEVGTGSTEKKKKKTKLHTEQAGATKVESTNVAQIRNNSAHKKHKQKNKSSSVSTDQDTGISDARLKAYGINPKKFKNKLKYSNKKVLGERQHFI